MKPVLERAPHDADIPQTRIPDQKEWVFSLKYWKQIENFGLGDQNQGWFISLLNRFRDLGKISVEKFLRDSQMRDSFHYHGIKWDAKNIPIRRKDFDWLHDDILDNEEDFPFIQLSISGGTGRVVGFMFRDVFNILLLDPKHNIHPAKSYSYSVSPTTFGQCQFSALYHNTQKIVSYSAKAGAPIPSDLWSGDFDFIDENYSETMFVKIDPETIYFVNQLISKGLVDSGGEVFKSAVLSYASSIADLLD